MATCNKLHYFNARGFAEVSRLLFAAAGQEFEDVRYSREEWAKSKDMMPLKAMPVLEIDGEKFCQSNAIARHLARTFGFYGKSNMDAFKIDIIHETVVEYYQGYFKAAFGPEESKEELMKTFKAETAPKLLSFLEEKAPVNSKGGGGFMVGEELSLADISVYQLLFNINRNENVKSLLDDKPKLMALYDKVGTLPNIAAWVKKRPDTEY